MTIKEAAELLNISERNIANVRTIQQKAPDKIAEIENGERPRLVRESTQICTYLYVSIYLKSLNNAFMLVNVEAAFLSVDFTDTCRYVLFLMPYGKGAVG